MHEVEAKIRLEKKEFDQLKKALQANKSILYKGQFIKKDIYYDHPIPYLVVRIRALDQKNYFHLKYRSMEEGVEINKEWEWALKIPSAFKRLLKRAGLKPFMKKSKRTDLFIWKKAHIELNYLRGLGYFLEVEKLVKDKQGIPKAKVDLEAVFKALGFHKSRFEHKSYLELLQTQPI